LSSGDGVGESTDGTDGNEGDECDAFCAKCGSLAATAGLTVDADGSVIADPSGAEADLTASAALWLWLSLGCG
jgi:hypothetical protein